jgi:dTDP-4-dehydrorhamnose 3,5-epimerase-like enzyme
MIETYKKPYLLELRKTGSIDIGYITPVNTIGDLPFEIKRTFITYYTPDLIVRGRHAHKKTEQILVAVSGRIVVNTEDVNGELNSFLLDTPYKSVYIPPNVWHTMQYQVGSVQLVFASTEYNEKDYIRDYESFKKYWTIK